MTRWVHKSRSRQMAKVISTATNRQIVSNIAQSKWVRRIIFYALLLVLWQVVANSGIWPDYVFPGPIAVWNSLVDGFLHGLFLQASLASLQRLAIGYGISLVIGVTLGLLIGRNRLFEETAGSLILGLQALPSVCWPPRAILSFCLIQQAVILVRVVCGP